MADTEFKKVFGWIEGVTLGATSSGEKFFKIIIDGKYYNWFTESCDLKIADYVEGLFFEVQNPKNINTPYKNIKSLEKKSPPKTPTTGRDVFQMAAICAAVLASGTSAKQNDPEEWIDQFVDSNRFDKLICSVYNRLKLLEDKLCEKAS